MKNLGKIIVLFLLTQSAFAALSVSVDQDTISRGERVTMTIKVTGEGQVRVPPFDELCGVSVEGKMQSRKDVIANGKRSQELSLMYEFMPQRSCVIEPFPVSVNDVETLSQPINITVSKMTISKNEPFMVSLETDKKSVYVGEPFEMRVNFKKRQNISSLGDSISLAESKNIWIKSEHAGAPFMRDRYENRTNMYAMSAQQSGILSLGPLRWDVKVRANTRDYWGFQRAKTRTLFSNELEVEVKPLPKGVELVGDLSIEAHVDKTEINAGEAVNLSINVKGRANVEDIASFSIYLKEAQAFNEDPKISHFLQDGRYFGSFEQKSALVAERDFVIPAFELSYMDISTDTVKTIKTEAISIKVLNATPSKKEELKISRPVEEVQDVNLVSNTLTLVQGGFLVFGGFVLGLIFSMIPWKRIFTKEKSKSIISAKESKEVLQLLMSNMSKDDEIEALVKNLSENLYEGKSHEINKKRLKDIVKRLQN